MKILKKSLVIALLTIILIYTVNVTGMPNNVILFENEKLNLKGIFGIELKEEKKKVIEVSSSGNKIEDRTITVSLFNLINLKKIEVSTIKNTKVIPLGNTVGIKLYSDGVLVIGMTEVGGCKPYENTGIKEGDLITKVDNVGVTTTTELIECVNNSAGKNVEIEYIRDGVEYVTNIEPVKTSDNSYKIGLWVRDGAVGIGTATYYEPESKKIATLGHGIIDRDTDKLITIESGELATVTITRIKKGEKGNPGEISGIINGERIIGDIDQNTKFGIYGNLWETSILGINEENALEVALKEEIKVGKAKILLALEDGIRKEYEIEIKKIYKNNTENNKSMLIEITDKELIEKTGGIVQRNEWCTNNSKWKIYWSNHTCSSK